MCQAVPGTNLQPRFSLERMSSAFERPKPSLISSLAQLNWAYHNGIAALIGFVLMISLVHNAANTRGFVVEAKPQRKSRRRAWLGYARSALKLSPMTYEDPTSRAVSGGYSINSVPVHLLGTLTSSGFIRIGCSFKACKILSANGRGKRPRVPYLEATMPSTTGLWFKNRCKYSALPNIPRQLLKSVPKRYAGSQ